MNFHYVIELHNIISSLILLSLELKNDHVCFLWTLLRTINIKLSIAVYKKFCTNSDAYISILAFLVVSVSVKYVTQVPTYSV